MRYSKGSGLFRILVAPHVGGNNPFIRIAKLAGICLRHPLQVLKAITVRSMVPTDPDYVATTIVDGSRPLDERGRFTTWTIETDRADREQGFEDELNI